MPTRVTCTVTSPRGSRMFQISVARLYEENRETLGLIPGAAGNQPERFAILLIQPRDADLEHAAPTRRCDCAGHPGRHRPPGTRAAPDRSASARAPRGSA